MEIPGLGEGQRGGGVPELVRADGRNPRLLAQPHELVPDVLGIEPPTFGIEEDDAFRVLDAVDQGAPLELPEALDEVFCENKVADLIRLGGAPVLELAVDPLQLPANGNGLLLKIKVLPADAGGFADARAGGEHEHPELGQVIVECGPEEARGLLRPKEDGFLGGGLGEFHLAGGIDGDKALLDGIFERGMEYSPDEAEGGAAEELLIGLGVWPSGGDHLSGLKGDEILDIGPLDVLNALGAEDGDDVLLDQPDVLAMRIGGEIGADVLIEPLLEIGAEVALDGGNQAALLEFGLHGAEGLAGFFVRLGAGGAVLGLAGGGVNADGQLDSVSVTVFEEPAVSVCASSATCHLGVSKTLPSGCDWEGFWEEL